MQPNEQYAQLAGQESVEKVVRALTENGMAVFVVQNGEEAKKKMRELLPEGAEVFTMTSQTLETTGIAREVNESGKFNSVRNKLTAMDRKIQGKEMRQLGAAPEWTLGSVHAVTEDGQLIIASNTGSQLGAYAYSAMHVIWVVGTQKIVENMQEGLKRIYEYSLPLEDARIRKVYGVGSFVSKILIVNKEIMPKRIIVILVKEKLGF